MYFDPQDWYEPKKKAAHLVVSLGRCLRLLAAVSVQRGAALVGLVTRQRTLLPHTQQNVGQPPGYDEVQGGDADQRINRGGGVCILR